MYYLNYFFIFSIIGHFLETFIYPSGESGILLSFWTPIYGIGTVIILLINYYLNKLKLNKLTKFIYIFLISSIVLSIIEALGGYLIEWIFGITFWNYSYLKFNIGKYAALEISLIWGLGSILIIYFIKPFLDKIISKIPKYFTYILIILFIIDIILTIVVKH